MTEADDAAGEISARLGDDALTGERWVSVTQDLGAVKYGFTVPVTAEMLGDARWYSGWLAESFDRWLRPWTVPDPNPMPFLNWWPWLSRRLR